MDKHLKIGLLVCAALLAFGGLLPFITTPTVQTEAQAKYEADLNAKYEADLNKAQSLRPFVYSSEPPQPDYSTQRSKDIRTSVEKQEDIDECFHGLYSIAQRTGMVDAYDVQHTKAELRRMCKEIRG
jgi:hypothetical protein